MACLLTPDGRLLAPYWPLLAPYWSLTGPLLALRYDALIVDLYTGDNPLEMLTSDSLGQLKRAWLQPGGALVVNVVAFYTGPHVALARDVVRTLRSVFGHVRCFVDRPPHLSPDVPTNLVSE